MIPLGENRIRKIWGKNEYLFILNLALRGLSGITVGFSNMVEGSWNQNELCVLLYVCVNFYLGRLAGNAYDMS